MRPAAGREFGDHLPTRAFRKYREQGVRSSSGYLTIRFSIRMQAELVNHLHYIGFFNYLNCQMIVLPSTPVARCRASADTAMPPTFSEISCSKLSC